MPIKELLKMLLKYFKRRIKLVILFFSFSVVFVTVFSLYSLPIEPVVYSCILCFALAFLAMIIDCAFYCKKHYELKLLYETITIDISALPTPSHLIEADYNALITSIFEYSKQLTSSYNASRSDMLDYYTMWVHQIKTPISAITMLLQSSECDIPTLKAEVFKIEQYVEMVLYYLRLDSDSTDYKIKSYPIDDIVKKAVRKYATLFITKKIKLNYNELNFEALTDEKWLLFVIEQLLSNSLKYTNEGSITITCESPKILVIKDTGIGISKEDLPRIFEKGFVGYNGRIEQKSTGIGLYICKKIIKKLSHGIAITSDPNNPNDGTEVRLYLESHKQVIE